MLKIGKGLKKKKKSKKNKHKEDELFTEEELNQYRREHCQKAAEEAQENSEAEKAASEEFEKFKQLTAGVDDILRKSQGNLDRIKKESFFQRKPTPSERKAQEEQEKKVLEEAEESRKKQEEEEREDESESEEELDDQDDIFDTAYVDVLESGEVKLAYIPDDDEVAENEGPDPFDTSSAGEVLKKAEEVEKKKKLEISLGLAATVLSGRAERDKSILAETGAAELIDQTIQPVFPGVKPKKRPRKIQDVVLIGSFDEGSNTCPTPSESVLEKASEAPKSLLDDDLNVDCPLPEGETLITEVLVKQHTEGSLPENAEPEDKNSNLKDLVSEFDVIKENVSPEVRKAEEVEDEFDEFTALAVSSVTNQKLEEELQKFEHLDSDPFDTSSTYIVLKQEPADPFGNIDANIPSPQTAELQSTNQKWSAFTSENPEKSPEVDPFDTTFAEKIQPGKCELKLLESEILGDIKSSTCRSDEHQEARILSRNNSDSDFDPRAGEDTPKPNTQSLLTKVSIQITDPSGFVETQRSSESEFRDGDLVSLSFKHRDLLGGSTTDLTKLGKEPLPPEVESPVEDFSKYCDPFDTSIVDQVALPGKAELKFIEKELLSDILKLQDEDAISDKDFDPRKEENTGQKSTVSFDIPSPVTRDLLSSHREVRPLTPYYSDVKDSESDTCEIEDPFDTSHVSSLPGKEEIKIIEKELNSIQITEPELEPLHKKLGLEEIQTSSSGLKHSLSDQDLNPPGEVEPNQIKLNISGVRRHSDITGLSRRPPSLPLRKAKPDLLVVEEEHPVKALTPAVEEDISSYIDPFDTSIAENIAFGKAELKVLERELILNSAEGIKRSYTDPDFNPREGTSKPTEPDLSQQSDILNLPENSAINIKPLTPLEFETTVDDEIDPFDTSIATNLLPGKAEIRVLESELFVDDATDYGVNQNGGASSNPFLNSELSTEPTGTDNPFLTSSYNENFTLPETNPFADFNADYGSSDNFFGNQGNSWQQPTQDYGALPPLICSKNQEPQPDKKSAPNEPESRPNELGLLTSTVTSINDPENDLLLSSDEEASKPKRPPPPHPTIPKETKDLILNVTGALKATSDHLLDRLPPTRAPSPTSFPDFQVLSPTPDTFTDLLGTAQLESSQANLPQFPSNEDLNVLTKPEKPPPPKLPPGRPAPPKPAPPAQVQKPLAREDDMFDLFGTSKPPPPKTKDAILNLYSQPKPPPKDLLTDDLDIPAPAAPLMENEIQQESQTLNLLSSERQQTQEISKLPESIAPQPLITTFPKPEVKAETPAVEDCSDKKSETASFVLNAQADGFDTPKAVDTAKPVEVEKPLENDIKLTSVSNEEPPYLFGTKPQETVPSSQEAAVFEPAAVAPEVPIFGTTKLPEKTNLLPETNAKPVPVSNETVPAEIKPQFDAFDAFAAKFESTGTGGAGGANLFDPFSGSGKSETDAWGSTQDTGSVQQDFGTDDTFDAFLSLSRPPAAPHQTPNRFHKAESGDSEDGGFNVFIKPRQDEALAQTGFGGAAPVLAPPPKSSAGSAAFSDNEPRFNPFDKGEFAAFTQEGVQMPPLSQTEPYEGGFKKSDSQETPPTPLFDEDVSQPLEDFPRIHYAGEGWEMQLRQPNKKKITGQRFWKKIFVKLVYQGDNPVLQLFNVKEDKDPFQELPLQACYSVSDISAQQYDQFGKIFTVKLQYIFYKERPGVRPGQVTKAERITNKLSQFAAYAIQGDYQGVKEFGSDLKKLGLPVEHAPQISQLLKLGSMSYEDLKQFSVTLEECLFRMPVHRDRALNYKMEEVQITVVDEIYVEQHAGGHVEKQIARVRLFFLGFLSGMPDVELGLNDMWRQGKEVVGRHDIIPVVTEEWIRLEAVEFHSCIQQEEYEKTRTIKFKPPDACYIELMRFRIRPPRNRELPLQLKAVMCITGSKVELRADVLVPGFASRKLGQIPCEDVMIRFPIPECWIYLFRVEKHFRYGSVKSAHRRTGKIKGIERFLGAVDTLEPSLLEVTSGQAKYEHQHRSIVWRMPRLPKEGQGAYTTHNLVCRMQLTSFDQIPDNLAEYAYVEFTMPATQASHTTVRSVSLVDSPSDNPPEKYVRQLARHEYRVGIEHVHQEETAAYEAATIVKPKVVPDTIPETPAAAGAAESDSDSSD